MVRPPQESPGGGSRLRRTPGPGAGRRCTRRGYRSSPILNDLDAEGGSPTRDGRRVDLKKQFRHNYLSRITVTVPFYYRRGRLAWQVRAPLRAFVRRRQNDAARRRRLLVEASARYRAPHRWCRRRRRWLAPARGRQLRRWDLGHLDGLGIFLVDSLRTQASPGGDSHPTVPSLA